MPEPVARSATFKGCTGDRMGYARHWEREGGVRAKCGQALIGLFQGLRRACDPQLDPSAVEIGVSVRRG